MWQEGCGKGTYLALHKVTNACLGHDGNGDGFHNLLDHLGVAHACYAALSPDVGGDTLKSHDGRSTSLFCYACLHLSTVMHMRFRSRETYLLGIDDVHDNATLQHAGKSCLDCEVVLAILSTVAVCGGEFSCHCLCDCDGYYGILCSIEVLLDEDLKLGGVVGCGRNDAS